jgi:hypothetical protein
VNNVADRVGLLAHLDLSLRALDDQLGRLFLDSGLLGLQLGRVLLVLCVDSTRNRVS